MTSLRIGEWRFDPASGKLSRNEEVTRLDLRTARLLACLAEHAGEVMSSDELLNQVWAEATVSQDSVYQAVASLRRALGDDAKDPKYIETVPKLGYRLLAAVSRVETPLIHRDFDFPQVDRPQGNEVGSTIGHPSASLRGKRRVAWIVAASACVLLGFTGWALLTHKQSRADSFLSGVNAAPPNSIAVLPFLDLTEGMKNEEFADGITEELIDKISKIPALRVASPTSSFYFKAKQVPLAEMARSLGVAWILDGSLRKSGTWVRVDARLVRAANGYIAWSATYDQPMSDILTIQDDIAGKVTRALQGSIGSGAHSDAFGLK